MTLEGLAPAERAAAPEPHHRRRTCRVCGGDRLTLFLSLGPMPLANAFLASAAECEDEPAYPLDVYFCESCSLVQLLDVIDPRVLFSRYLYVTGTSDTIAAHNIEYARSLVNLLDLRANDLVVEIASNDGSLLKRFQPYGVRTLGIEPAANIAEIAQAQGVETLARFFNSSAAAEVREAYGAARVVIGNNVLAHVDEVRDFLTGCRALLDPAGLVVVEVPYLGELLERLEYDTIYHEHLSYFSVTALVRLCEAAGLVVARLDAVPVHGGSLRVFAGRPEHYGEHSSSACEWALAEERAGLNRLARYERFAVEVAQHARSLRRLLLDVRKRGSLAGYGAPAKGNTLLNYAGIGPDLLPYTVDKSALKVGRFTPGMHIPVLPVSTLLERQPDYALILAWNFAEEIMGQQSEYRARGGRWIVPLPEPRVV